MVVVVGTLYWGTWNLRGRSESTELVPWLFPGP